MILRSTTVSKPTFAKQDVPYGTTGYSPSRNVRVPASTLQSILQDVHVFELATADACTLDGKTSKVHRHVDRLTVSDFDRPAKHSNQRSAQESVLPLDWPLSYTSAFLLRRTYFSCTVGYTTYYHTQCKITVIALSTPTNLLPSSLGFLSSLMFTQMLTKRPTLYSQSSNNMADSRTQFVKDNYCDISILLSISPLPDHCRRWAAELKTVLGTKRRWSRQNNCCFHKNCNSSVGRACNIEEARNALEYFWWTIRREHGMTYINRR